MATIINISYDVNDETVTRIEEHLENVALRDVNWNGANFEIERDEFTSIEDDSYDAARLLNEIQAIIDGRV
jgi:protein tyrosine/serine phosphatase